MADMEIFMIIDGSGSMSGVKNEVVKGINDFIDEQKRDAKSNMEQVLFTLTSFDDKVQEIYAGEDIDLVNPLTLADTFLGGSTALYDAIGRTLSRVEDNTRRKLVVVYTDGNENASREFKADQIKEMISDFEATGDWTFVYMSAELADFAQPKNLGFRGANTLTGTSRGSTYDQFMALSGAAHSHRNADNNAAVANSNSFYTNTMSAATLDGFEGQLGEDPEKEEENE